MAIERIVPGSTAWDAYYANHIFRYQFAQQQLIHLHQATLLDAACGVGYGTAFLADSGIAKSVVGVDLSKEALDIAKRYYQKSGTTFLADNCQELTQAATHGPFQGIISFETLEHLPQPQLFLQKCFQLLTEGGKLIVSTPNQLVSSPDALNWQYHEKEYTAAEFDALLRAAGFKQVALYGQQFTLKGRIKNEVRADLNRLYSNPFARLGSWIQRAVRGVKPVPVLAETVDDFEIATYTTAEACDKQGRQGPFVLLAVAEK